MSSLSSPAQNKRVTSDAACSKEDEKLMKKKGNVVQSLKFEDLEHPKVALPGVDTPDVHRPLRPGTPLATLRRPAGLEGEILLVKRKSETQTLRKILRR
ncbi:hypothetical protein TNCV_1645401 [Trichonephila clavipes]|nr:hypothetical protein TNCV_1645401 [Trichonephila clavipes]